MIWVLVFRILVASIKLAGKIVVGSIYGFYVICRGLIQGVRSFGLPRELLADTLICPRGHENSTVGTWICPNCEARRDGWVFEKCPACYTVVSYFKCVNPICQLPIVNPLQRRGYR